MLERLGHDDLKGARVGVQWLGNVGWHLARRLSDAGAILMVLGAAISLTDRRHRVGAPARSANIGTSQVIAK